MKISSSKIDSSAIQSEDGEWQGDLPELGDISVLVRGLNNKQYRLKFEAMVRALPPAKRRNGAVDPIERDRIIGVCMLEHVLLGWKNVQDDAGADIAFSKDQAKIFLTDPDYLKFRDGVFIAATRVGEMTAEEEGTTAKNSVAPSATA